MKIVLTGIACAFALLTTMPSAYADPPTHNTVCLDAGNIDHYSYPDDKTILFHMNAGKVRIWRNDLPRACPGLKFEQGIALEIRGGVICSNMQVVYVLRRWTPCFLGAFTPYTPPPKATEQGAHD
ncbi:MAG: hypothetical protein KGI68_14715 [Alphaproteobacteria bacterium]|nr:hypothetical protein [Alphaproteobacteria bacterium]MDE1985342.1 hypothetical protein [Alphaproteobacteria bacterium]MDE2162031.1 hypothetical protein [Alphaproteobacteria bacterium]MDE2265395.1 hypothetical protein [Alphaproteobacteria bacterium]MDE2500271.1 hypothetical protein [Alphaproteobacteria bacterium]